MVDCRPAGTTDLPPFEPGRPRSPASSMVAVKLRPATCSDAAAIATVHAASWRSAYRGIAPDSLLDGPLIAERERYWQEKLPEKHDGDVVLLAESDQGQPVGFLTIWVTPQAGTGGYVDNLHLVPAWRGRGLGPHLLLTGVEPLVAAGVATGFLWVLCENRPAIRFYERLDARRDREGIRVMGGVDVRHCRYVWNDLPALAKALQARLVGRSGAKAEVAAE